MRILRLHLQNVHALRNQWTIQFDQFPLYEAGLFAITGPTGGGKSSLLDAMIVALYGRVPRYGHNTPTELMTRHTAETLIELDFSVQQGRFRARWNLRRARGQATGRVQPARHELQNLETNQTLDLRSSDVPKEVEKLTGLNMERFLRSVILPQGDFAAFLRAKEKERGELLEELTGLHVYSELSELAFSCSRESREALEKLQQQLGTLPLLEEEALRTLRQRLDEYMQQRPKLQATEQRLQGELGWLRQLRESRATCSRLEQEILAAQQALEAFAPQQQRLQRHHQLQPFQPQWQSQQKQAKQLEQQQFNQQRMREELGIKQQEVQQLEVSAQQDQERLQDQEKQYQQLIEPIRLALEVDAQIQTQQVRWESRQQEQTRLEQTIHQQRQQLLQEDAWVQQAVLRQQQRQQWLVEHDDCQQLELALPELRSIWQQWQQKQQQWQQSQAALDRWEKQQAEDAKQSSELQQLENDLAEEALPLEQRAQALREQEETLLEGRPLGDWQATQRDAQRLLRLGEKLTELGQRFQDVQLERSKYAQQEQELQLKLGQLEEQHLHQEHLRQQTQERLHDKQRLLEQGRLIRDYEAARTQLQPNQPCPLCGSTEHPFVISNEVPSVEQEVELVEHLKQRCKEIEQELTNLQREQTQLKARSEITHERSGQLQQETQKIQSAFDDVNSQIPAESVKLLTDLVGIQMLHLSWQEQFQAMEQKLSAVEKLDGMRRQLQEEQITLQNKRAELKERQAGLNERQKLHQRQQEDLEKQAKEEQQLVLQLQESWQEQAQAVGSAEEALEPESLLASLQEKWQAFQKQQQAEDREGPELLQRRQRLERDQATLGQQEQQQQSLAEEQQQELAKLQLLQQQRLKILEHPDPKALEQEQLSQLQACQEKQAASRRSFEEKSQALQQEQQRLQWMEEEYARGQQEYTQNQEELLFALQALGYASIAEAETGCLDSTEAEELNQQDQQLNQRLSISRHDLGNEQMRRAALEQEARTTQTEEELQAQLEQLRQQQDELSQQLGGVQVQLEKDAELRQNQRTLTDQIEKQQQEHRRWASLSELIGSADGTKFSRFAQSLTLAHLVNLANRHLQKLSDRYQLQKRQGACVEMDIVDRYQADAVRSLESLSGGETFLVSLALALGLSDLARRNHPIDSLFIDEGFGTLDADTLDTALAALETLQAGGKTIGIISHVEALKERLTTQIQVRKNDSGNSTLAVIPKPLAENQH
ncbi:MAG: AAA family ATPase, partial [Deltaproteobacteria bacterium]